uniref:Uncharacterized protein n=1 Tax=Cacopsylla melanoneura TaxID=428564 RepID=A0A8D9BAD1_9HEMI
MLDVRRKILSQVRTLSLLCVVFGLNPICIKMSTWTRLWRRLYALLWVGAILYQVLYTTRKLFKFAQKTDSVVQLTTDIIQLTFVEMTSILCVITNLINRQIKVDILDRFAKVDEDLARLGENNSRGRNL